MIEVVVALQKTKAARVAIEIRVKMHTGRVRERTPDPLARTGMHKQTVGIVDLRTPIIGRASIVLAAHVHAGKRRNAETLDRIARIERNVDVHDERCARVEIEAVSACHARRVEQRMERQSS